VEVGIALVSLYQKTRVFMVLVVLGWSFLEYAHKVFDEMCERW
jgi:hypothetical protein